MTLENILHRATPESQGVDSTSILAFVNELDQTINEVHSLMLLRHGQVIAEGWWSPYAPHLPHMLFSLSKSFTSTAVGLAIAEGRLSLDDPVFSFFPGETPKKASDNLKAMRVRQLLCMSTGHDQDTLGPLMQRRPHNWVKAILALPVKHKPGTHFVYNTGATYLLSAIIQKVSGEKLIDYLQPRLFAPLGIQNATWETCPLGINTGGYGLSVKTEDIARLGQLYLDKGRWQGVQVLPEAWVAEATARQVSNGSNPESDWEQGYAYQFWRCRHNIYRGDGAFGQYCIVMPAQDAVLAITAGVEDMQPVLNVVWKHMLPAMRPAPLPADAKKQAALAHKLAELAFTPPLGKPAPKLARSISGKRYQLDINASGMQQLAFEFTDQGCTLTLKIADREQQVQCGNGAWMHGMVHLEGPEPSRVAASGAWLTPDTYAITLRLYETPFIRTYTCRFTGDTVQVNTTGNVSFGPKEGPTLVGKLLEN